MSNVASQPCHTRQEIPLSKTTRFVIDNRGRTAPTEKNGIPLIATNCISNYNLYPVYEKLRYVSQDTYENWFRSHPEPGDILLTLKGSQNGAACLVPAPVDFVIAQDMVGLRADEKVIDPLFLFAALRSPDVQAQIKNLDVSGVIPHLKKSDFDKLLLPYPDRNTQQSIGQLYFCMSKKIDLLHRQNQTLEAMAATLFRQWFVEEAQEDWAKGKLGEEFDFTMGQSPPGSSFNVEGRGVPMFQGNADFEFRFPKERIYTTAPTRFAQRFDILISVRAPVGAQNMAHKECCIGRGVSAFRYKNNNDFYTYTYFKLHALMEEIKKFNDEGTVFGSIGKSDFDALEITLPPSELIIEFEKSAKPMNDKVIENCAQIRTLENLRDTLLPKLMSGEVRVGSKQSTSQHRASSQFQEAVLISCLTDHFASHDYPLGRKRYTKLSYLFHRHNQDNTEAYLRKAAGPYNPSTRYQGPESIALKNGYIQKQKRGNLQGFVAADKISKARQYFANYWDNSALDWLKKEFVYKTNDELELLATVDHTLIELQTSGKDFSVENVKAVIESEKEWKAKLKREVFSDRNIENVISELRKLFIYSLSTNS